MVDTFGQTSPLVAFRSDSRPPSSASGTRRQNGLKGTSPPQMYMAEAPMATEEFTGTTSANSSPTKVPTHHPAAAVQYSNRNNANHAANLLIRKKGLPWLLASALVVIVVLLILCGFLLYILYEHNGFYSQFGHTSPVLVQQIQSAKKAAEAGVTRPKWPGPNPGSLEDRFAKAAVISENGMCSEIGRKVLLQGGNAMDTAIAVAACMGALNSHSAGFGGGFLMTYYQRFYGKCATIDARETAPSRATKDMFNDAPEESLYGYKAVAIPGALHGFWTAFKRFGSGKIAWMDLLVPTANLLSDGYPVSKLMAMQLEQNRDQILNGSHSGMRNHFVNPSTGDLYREGDLIRDPVLSSTYKRLALSHDPVQLFYSANGELAREIVDEFASNGGLLTRKDLHTYRTFVDDNPLLATGDADPKLVFCGAKPSSGFAIAQLIAAVLLKFYPPGSNASIPWESDEYYHRLIEAQKHAFALRTKLGDPKVDKIFEELALNMTKPEFVDAIVGQINAQKDVASKFADFAEAKEFVRDSSGTSQVTVVDADGNAVSMTCSINQPFGSLIRSPQLGLVWNNHMDDFAQPNETNSYGLEPAKSNMIEPGKRPMSSMSPMIVYQKDNRKIKIAIGASGGPMIPTAVSQVLAQLLAFNYSLKEAIDAPRLHNQFTPFHTGYEAEFPQLLLEKLRARGHEMVFDPLGFSPSVQAILLDSNGELVANNDFRRKVHSYPVGY